MRDNRAADDFVDVLTLEPEAELQQLVDTLDTIPVRVAVVSQSQMQIWGPPGQNQALEDYLATHFQESARFGEFRILVRREALP